MQKFEKEKKEEFGLRESHFAMHNDARSWVIGWTHYPTLRAAFGSRDALLTPLRWLLVPRISYKFLINSQSSIVTRAL